MKKWNENKRFNECLEEAFETYTSILSEKDDLDSDEMDRLETSLRDKIDVEDYETRWVIASELSQFNPFHNQSYDDKKDPQLFEGAIVVIKHDSKYLIVDGNHRANTLKDHYPDLEVYVVIIDLD